MTIQDTIQEIKTLQKRAETAERKLQSLREKAISPDDLQQTKEAIQRRLTEMINLAFQKYEGIRIEKTDRIRRTKEEMRQMREDLVKYLNKEKYATAPDIAQHFNITVPTMMHHLEKLIRKNRVATLPNTDSRVQEYYGDNMPRAKIFYTTALSSIARTETKVSKLGGDGIPVLDQKEVRNSKLLDGVLNNESEFDKLGREE